MPEDRTYPDKPLLGVSAAIWRDDKVLLVQRAKDPSRGFWSLPGGLVQTGERLEEAITREIAEETGLKVDIAGMMDTAEIIRPDATGKVEHHYVIGVFAGYWRSGNPVAMDDAADARWFSKQQRGKLKLIEGTCDMIEKSAQFLNKT